VTWWTIFAGYLLGWVLAVRPAMRRRMLQEVCDPWGHTRAQCECWGDSRYAPRGAIADRTGEDVAAAVALAAVWPAWLALTVVVKTSAAFGRGIKTAVDRATPLTRPELERRLAEQQQEIARLTAQIGAES
jgi:hypothetical protein